MITFERAFQIIMSSARELGTERIGIDSAVNRILAEDIRSDVDMPPFNKAAMDGYACRREDLGNELTVIETIPAGIVPRHAVGPNQCAKIMTGAMVPEGADCVVMVEFTENPTEGTVRFVGSDTGANLCPQGEDVRAGDVALRQGQRIRPQHIALLASVGCTEPPVAPRPRVAVIATGSELVPPAAKPKMSHIRNSNSSQLCAQLADAGGIPHNYGIAGDTEDAITRALKTAAAENDVLLFSGGISMGDFDLVPGILERNGFEILVQKVAVKPGKPTLFARSTDAFCFGMPGNPVSTFVVFEVLVKPFLYKLMGHDYAPPSVLMPLGKAISRKKTERESWIPVVLTDGGTVVPVEYHGPAHIKALCLADGLTSIPVGVAEMPEGTMVRVRPI